MTEGKSGILDFFKNEALGLAYWVWALIALVVVITLIVIIIVACTRKKHGKKAETNTAPSAPAESGTNGAVAEEKAEEPATVKTEEPVKAEPEKVEKEEPVKEEKAV